MSWPPIPTLLRGAGGPIRVRRVRKVRPKGVNCWGVWDEAKRMIHVDKTALIEHQWRVLFHELTHAAIDDAGIESLLNEEAIETICNAMATARIQEMRGELGLIDS